MGALVEHKDALEASLQAVYGIRLSAHDYGVLELANRVAHLPPGCALWRASGGPLAWSDEQHMLAEIEFGIRVLAWYKTKDGQNDQNRPKPQEPPLPAGQVRQDEERRSEKAERSRARRDRRMARQATSAND